MQELCFFVYFWQHFADPPEQAIRDSDVFGRSGQEPYPGLVNHRLPVISVSRPWFHCLLGTQQPCSDMRIRNGTLIRAMGPFSMSRESRTTSSLRPSAM